MKTVFLRCVPAFLVFLAVYSSASAQGGKAEPKRIEFAAGKTSTVLVGSLSNSQEMEYVFAAAKGQKVKIGMANTSLFDYRVFRPEADFETEFDSSPTLTIELPESGDYFLFVRKKMVSRPRTARFRLALSIK